MLRAPVVLPALLIAGSVLAGTARAQDSSAPGRLSDVTLPGGLRGALDAIHDPLIPDRGQFLLEFIRRVYDAPIRLKSDPRAAVLQALVAYLDESRRQIAPAHPETLPLPLTPTLWTDVVFGGRVAPQDLVTAILQSREAALFYTGLLSLDDETRAWLAGEPGLIRDIVSRYSAAFQVAAPGLRVGGAAVRVPGGAPAEAAWEALVGRRLTEPVDFVRAVLAERQGRFAYFLGAMAQLTPAQLRFALGLDSKEPERRVARARRLSAVFDRIALQWNIEQHAFWRPAVDPALLAADLRTGENGRPLLPGTRPFWEAAFAKDPVGAPAASGTFADAEPADFVWLCEQVFDGGRAELRSRYREVLFASRILTPLPSDSSGDAVDAVRAMGMYPALATALERARLRDVSAFALAARRAARLSAIGDHTRAVRALAQFQGVLALIARGVRRGSLPEAALPSLVSSLAAVDTSARGDYEGRVVRWMEQHLGAGAEASAHVQRSGAGAEPAAYDDPYQSAPGPIERDLLHLVSGPAPIEPRFVDWEGTRYRLDDAQAEAARIARILGQATRPYVSSAVAFADLADALQQPGLTTDQVRRDVDAAGRTWPLDRPEPAGASAQLREVMAALQRAARDGDVSGAGRLTPALRLAADDLLARGVLELVYATALGQPDRTPISAGDAAERHNFGLGSRHPGPWQVPAAASDPERGWYVTGSLLGLDVALADRSLVRLSLKPPSREPTLNGTDRRAFIEAVALIEPSSLTDSDRDAIVTAMKKGRDRLAALHTSGDAVALADEIRLAPARRSALAWMAEHERDRIAAFFSPVELFWLGTGDGAALQAWGAPAGARLGCLCLQITDRRPWESLAGRWNAGVMASAFPDLNLRVAELLAELRMPAPLLAPVLASATLDFVDTATSRDADDRRGLVEFVQAMHPEQVEEYLALLTTGGPLVPIGDAR